MGTSLATLLAGLAPQLEGCTLETQVQTLVADSREAGPGAAFLAVVGERVDGHDYLAAAHAQGAALLVVQGDAATPPDAAVVRLPDTAAARGRLAANLYGSPAQAMRSVGITGTNGKTTVAHLVSSIYEAAEQPHARLGTTGNWIVNRTVPTVFTTPFPLALQALLAQARELGAKHLVMEVSSHALAQGRVDPMRFDAIAMTSFSQDHLDFHPNMQAYLEAKLRLASQHLSASGVALAAVDDNSHAQRFLTTAQEAGAQAWALSRGAQPHADVRASELQLQAHGIEMRLDTPLGSLQLHSPLVGAFNVDNLMIAACLALHAGIDAATIQAALRTSPGAPGRLERVHVDRPGPAVYVDYAHTPDAVARALAVLRPHTKGRLIVVLGCGGDRDRKKRPMMGEAASRGADLFYASSDNPRTEDPERIVDDMLAGATGPAQVTRQVDRARAIALAIADAHEQDVVLIAGKGHEDYQVLGTEKLPFDDRVHARAALEARSS